jgi:hypothetical protein
MSSHSSIVAQSPGTAAPESVPRSDRKARFHANEAHAPAGRQFERLLALLCGLCMVLAVLVWWLLLRGLPAIPAGDSSSFHSGPYPSDAAARAVQLAEPHAGFGGDGGAGQSG